MISRDDFVLHGATIPSLEAFFGNLQRLGELVCWFPGLQELTIVAQPHVTSLVGLAACPRLRRLTVCECALTSTHGLSKNESLASLVLYSNHITDLQDLQCLRQLATLDLSDNCLGEMGKLPPLPGLTSLRLRGNGIRRLHRIQGIPPGDLRSTSGGPALQEVQLPLRCLAGLPALSFLDLSGNSILDVAELAFLQPLKSLSMLQLAGKDAPPNPVCAAVDYQRVLLQMLPQVTHLDDLDVAGAKAASWRREMCARAQAYATMRHQWLLNAAAAAASTAWEGRQSVAAPIMEAVRPLREGLAAMRAALASGRITEALPAALREKMVVCERFLEEVGATRLTPALAALPLPHDVYRDALQPHADLSSLSILGGGHISVSPAGCAVALTLALAR